MLKESIKETKSKTKQSAPSKFFTKYNKRNLIGEIFSFLEGVNIFECSFICSNTYNYKYKAMKKQVSNRY